ncbi:replicative DNA helicase [Fuerstiella marisgermanici]|uniref:Replicative DNA helicase n=1 Tax=Fuerstiella marisgermanici TaxID=1891926 RepID=A0A1P8WK50_9PLAN|nr:replicative DNA helicase [Fuerstiella marisgermanici]APZ94433.1 Replicative DNA helicase [Fuerstiella marisgermanici]
MYGDTKTSAGPDKFRIPPQNLDAERGVLGSIMLLNEAIDDVGEVLKADHFYSDAHQKIYTAIRDLYENNIRGIDGITLANELKRRGELEDVGGGPYIAEILDTVPHAAHVRYYSNIVREKWLQRSLIYGCTEILSESYELTTDIEDLLQSAERRIFGIVEQQEGAGNIAIGDILMDAFDRIEERINTEGDVSGTTTGFADLDAQTTGLQPTELVILAARPSMGKTAFVCNVAEAVARDLKGVLLFSLEQSNLELAERFLCLTAKVNGHDLRAGNLTAEDRDKLMMASDELSRLPLYIDDKPGRTMGQIAALARRLHRKSPLGVIIIDYLQLVEPDDKNSPREQQIAGISRRLKFLAKELRVPVIALAQLNRGVELREDKRPRLADLRESGAIEQDADMVMFLHRPDAYDPEDRPGEAEIVVAKHRSGPTGIVRLTWRKEFMRFENYAPMPDTDFDL